MNRRLDLNDCTLTDQQRIETAREARARAEHLTVRFQKLAINAAFVAIMVVGVALSIALNVVVGVGFIVVLLVLFLFGCALLDDDESENCDEFYNDWLDQQMSGDNHNRFINSKPHE